MHVVASPPSAIISSSPSTIRRSLPHRRRGRCSSSTTFPRRSPPPSPSPSPLLLLLLSVNSTLLLLLSTIVVRLVPRPAGADAASPPHDPGERREDDDRLDGDHYHSSTRLASPDYSAAAYASIADIELRRVRVIPSLLSSTSMSDYYDYDLLVIGAGSGGIACARRAASHGARVGVVERGRLGGTCVNVGCVPKKVMFNAASVSEVLDEMHHHGFSDSRNVDGLVFDWDDLRRRRDTYVMRLNGIYERNLNESGVVTLRGTAGLGRRRGRIVVLVSSSSPGIIGEDGTTIIDATTTTTRAYTARRILLATGGSPTVPNDVVGASKYAITSDGFFELSYLPRKAVVIGGGYVAVELAGILNALGSDTSLVVRRGRALWDFDEMLSSTLDEEMRRRGIRVYANTDGVDRIEADEDDDNDGGRGTNGTTAMGSKTKTVFLRDGRSIGGVDVVVMAIGRDPEVGSLNLAEAGVMQREGGYVVTNEYSETTAEGVYAVGDVTGNVELTPVAIAAGRRLADRLFGPPGYENAKVSYENVPTVVFSHPPIGTIGLTERDAVAKYGEMNLTIYRSKFSNLYYGPWDLSPDERPKTAMKLVCAGSNELVVGLHVIGMGADEMLQGFGIAMKMGATKGDFDSCVAIHPTAAEEFVTMFPWGLGSQATGAKVSPLNGAASPEPAID